MACSTFPPTGQKILRADLMEGAEIIINKKKFSCERLNVVIPNGLEVVWGLVKPKNTSAKFNRIIACSFIPTK